MKKEEEMPKTKKRISMIAKVLIMSIGCVLLSLVVSTLVSTNIASNRLVENGKTNLVSLAVSKGNALEDFVNSQKTLVHSVANSARAKEVCEAYKETGKMDPDMQESFAAYLAEIQSDSGNLYENFFLTVGSEGFADCLGNVTLHDISEEAMYADCMSAGYRYGNAVSPVSGSPVYEIAYAVKDDSGIPIGVVNCAIDLATMSAQIVADDTYDIMLFNFDGLAIAAPQEESILTLDMNQQDPSSWADVLSKKTGVLSFVDPYTGV